MTKKEKDCSTCRHKQGMFCERVGGACKYDYEYWEAADGRANSTPAEKTLLDEFAMAAPYRVFEEGHHGMASFASSAYDYAAAMMREKMRRDEMGNAKEANT